MQRSIVWCALRPGQRNIDSVRRRMMPSYVLLLRCTIAEGTPSSGSAKIVSVQDGNGEAFRHANIDETLTAAIITENPFARLPWRQVGQARASRFGSRATEKATPPRQRS